MRRHSSLWVSIAGLWAAGFWAAGLWAGALWAAGALAQDAPPEIEETAKDIVATTVRAQGHPCEQPQSAVRDEAGSPPDRPAWVVECANASYWVRYDNDEPAEIRRLD